MHTLVVGGTGMLRGVSLWLAREGHTVSLVARRPERVGNLTRINPLALDYRNDGDLRGALQKAMEGLGPIGLAVCSIDRTEAPAALNTVARELARHGLPFRLLHVRGSAAAHPDSPPEPGLSAPPPNCTYQQVILGWHETGAGTRWLTHEEICAGVIEAVLREAPITVVGLVRPWHRRPSYT